MVKGQGFLLLWVVAALALEASQANPAGRPNRLELAGEWRMQSSAVDPIDGARLSPPGTELRDGCAAQVPTTVRNALTKACVYPDLRIGLNAYQIPDSSDGFNARHDLSKFSHLPDKRNPWRDPWWFRREFTLPKLPADRRVWLHFDAINYRADGGSTADRSLTARGRSGRIAYSG